MIQNIPIHCSTKGIWAIDHRFPKSASCFSFGRKSEDEHASPVPTRMLSNRFEGRVLYLQFLDTILRNRAPCHLGHAHVDGCIAVIGDVVAGNDLPELVVDVERPLGCEVLGLNGLLEGLVWLCLDALFGGLVEGVGYGKRDHLVLHLLHLLVHLLGITPKHHFADP